MTRPLRPGFLKNLFPVDAAVPGVPANAILDETGEAILDETGGYILDES